ncbi:MAG: hypothetical protein KKG86_12375 [Gammaproteobacteria bacterium]|nr:hypothetical protein [Gammaproteobacteria bacterium]MBU2129757.1 hypothetical protein [Gammaproteobacteria bacterium]MDP3187925.1 hypothetical protein [Limnobacter sp.]MDZ4296929.1 hypothetical protein [Moraxellaceae bacterium]
MKTERTVQLLGGFDDWDLAEYLNQDIPERNEFFIIYLGDKLTFDVIKQGVDRLNAVHLMSKGYSFELLQEPSISCLVGVRPGWELAGEAQKRLFLSRFVEVVEGGGANGN